MVAVYLILLILLCGGFCSLLLGRRPEACFVASAATMAAGALGLVFSVHLLLSPEPLTGSLPIPLPLGQCAFMADQFSAVFLLPVFLLSCIGGMLLPARMLAMPPNKTHYGRHGFFFCLLTAGMVLVLTAADSVFFLLSWEVMSLAPFFLLGAQDKDSKERFSGWIYLVAAHLGVLPLLLLFAAMGLEAGDTSFLAFAAHPHWQRAELFFILALIGFGVKTGLFPLHIWMPEAYPAAPGHVAAVLSGAMVNMGLYGIVRVIMMLGAPPVWWAYLLMAVGGASGVLGILAAMAQPDMKRTLAYSSAENMGIIVLALGGGMLAGLHGAFLASVLLFSGALLHMWNHSLFKSLYFLGASAVNQSTGTTSINQLGGLQKRMPFAGACMGAASAAISGAPPFNGFAGEALMYMGFIAAALATKGQESNLVFWAGLFTLAGIAGFSLLCFSRLYGLVFLGAPRSSAVHHGQAAGKRWRTAMALLAALCLVSSLATPGLVIGLKPAVKDILAGMALPQYRDSGASLSAGTPAPRGMPNLLFSNSAAPYFETEDLLATDTAVELWPQAVERALEKLEPALTRPLLWLSGGNALLLVIFGLIFLYRRRLIARNSFEAGLTWDCGYRYPAARMQYTGGAFAEFPLQLLRALLHPTMDASGLTARGDFFPRAASARLEATDWPSVFWRTIAFQGFARLADVAKDVQRGVVNLYILYMLVALLAALVWALGWS